VQWYQTDIVILGMLLIGCLWLLMDRLLFVPLERVTVMRWGLIQR
jgi:NitT/TauT family transport system permease protein/taurine transport system permease protein